MQLLVKGDFCYYDIVIKKGLYSIIKDTRYYTIKDILLIPNKIIDDNKYYFNLIQDKKDETVKEITELNLFKGAI